MSADAQYVLYFPKLEKPEDFKQWKHQNYEIIRRDDTTLIAFSEKHIGARYEDRWDWKNKSAKKMWNLGLCLEESVLATNNCC